MKGGESSMKRLTLSGTRRALEPALRRLLHVYWRFARAMTLGVRALVIDVNPLLVFCRFGESVDALLGHHQPIRHGDLTAYEFLKRKDCFHHE